MKTATIITAIATTTLMSVNMFAQTQAQDVDLTLTITNNSNVAVQQPKSMFIDFEGDGLGISDLDPADSTSPPPSLLNTGPVGNTSNPTTPIIDSSAYPFSYSDDGYMIDKLDSRSELDHTKTVLIGFNSVLPATITFSVSSNNNPTVSFVYVVQVSTGQIYQVLDNPVDLQIGSTHFLPSANDYLLYAVVKPTLTPISVNCFGGNDGKIIANNPQINNWSYTIYQGLTPISSTTVSNPDTTIPSLQSGMYTVAIHMFGLLADSEKVLVGSPAQIVPWFTADNYSVYTGDLVNFTNQTTGADYYAWSFGDNSTIDSSINTSHSYLTDGNYPVTISAFNLNGCSVTFTDTIHVQVSPTYNGPSTTLINNPSSDPRNRMAKLTDVNVSSGSQKIIINQVENNQVIRVQIMNLNGQVIGSSNTSNSTTEFQVEVGGIYLVTITNENGETVSKRVLVN